MGITGNVGGATARALLAAGQKVRAVVRNRPKAAVWAEQGVELAEADMLDPTALAAAFTGVEGVFVMIPANFAPATGFPETRAIVAALRIALAEARPPKAVYLSSVGAHRQSGLGLITQLHILEQELSSLPTPNAFVRPAWFLENFQWDIGPARDRGEIDNFLSPPERLFPMVATADIGQLVARTLQETWSGNRYLELEGPRRYSPLEAVAALSRLLNREVKINSIPRDQWAARFEREGAAPGRIGNRIEMLDGFNSGLIDFEGKFAEHCFGIRTLEDVLRGPILAAIR
jgi:uncharacterized protein YbjT (DUF2867 family)